MVKTSKVLLAVIIVAAALTVAGSRTSAAENGFSSMVGSVGSSIKDGFSKMSAAVSPKPKPSSNNTSDATSLLVKAKPSAKLYVAVAQTYVSSDSLQEADDMYKRALKLSPEYADALIGYAQLKDRQGAYGEAAILYKKAAKAHPNNAAVFNGMGLCHATHGNFKPALSALQRAVQLEPRELKYRNNIAMVLVEMGRYNEAFSHFKTQYDDPVAHYNLAYLLQKRGDSQKALEHFGAAIQQNPQFEEARTWYNHLAGRQRPRQPVQQPVRQQQRWQQARVPTQTGMGRPSPAAQAAKPRIGPARTPVVHTPKAWAPQYQQPAATPGPSQPAVTQNAMQRTWAIPPRQPFVQRQPFAQRQAKLQRQTVSKQQSIARRHSISQRQLEALGPPAPPVPTTDEQHQATIQRLPPVEQSFESAQPLAPLPPSVTARLPARSETSNTPAASAQAAPLPGMIMPAAPPAAGTTRAPMVYPLPPVNE